MTTTRRRLLPGLLALALVVAACSSDATPDPSAAPSPPPSGAPSPPPSTPTPAPVPNVDYDPATIPAAGDLSAITGVVRGGDGLVAIGFNGGFGSILWTSADGREWRDITPAEFASAGITRVIELSGGGLVAVGRGDTINIESNLAAAWISADGYTWRQAADSPHLRGQILDVIETDDGLIAVGGIPGADSAGAWRSRDRGESWQRIGDDIEHAFLWSLVEGGPGLVAVGWRRTPEPSAAVWTSSDGGETWTLTPDPEDFTGFEAADVIANPDGSLVMVGSHLGGGRARAWTSADGLGWQLADIDDDISEAGIRAVLVTPIGLVAIGNSGMRGSAWASTDGGASWGRLGDHVPDAYFTSALVTDAGDLIVTGGTQEGAVETGITGYAMTWTAALD